MVPIADIVLADIMSRRVHTLAPDHPLEEAIALMAEGHVSSLVLTEGELPVGILTEQDVVRLFNAGHPAGVPVSAVMSAPVLTAHADLGFHAAYHRLQNHGIRHLVVTDHDGKVVGVVSETDFRAQLGLDVFRRVQSIHAVMDTDPVTIPATASLADALRRMATMKADYIVATESGRAVGMLTERDVPALLARHVGGEATTLAQVMSSPVMSIRDHASASEAAERMSAAGVRHLLVTDEMERPVGMISQHLLLERVGGLIIDSAWAQHRSADSAKQTMARELDLVLQATGAGLWSLDANTGTVAWDEGLCVLVGSPPEAAPRTLDDWLAMVHPDDRTDLRRRIDAAIAAQNRDELPLFETEYRLRCGSGEWRWLYARGGAMEHAADGSVALLAGIVTDVTGYRNAHQVLDIENEFARLVAEAPEDRNALLDGLLKAVLRLPEIDAGALLWRQACGDYVLVHQIGLPESVLSRIEVLAAGSDEVALIENGQLVCNCRRGLPHCLASVVVDRHLDAAAGIVNVVILPLREARGVSACLYLVSQLTDSLPRETVTALDTLARHLSQALARLDAVAGIADKQAELRRGRMLLGTLVQAIPDLVWAKDPEGVYLTCNSAFERLYGAVEADIIGRTDYDFVDSAQADFFRRHDRAAAAVGHPRTNEEWLTFAADGYHGLFQTVKTPMFDEQGQLVGVLGIARDITEQRAAEEALRASEESLRVLIDTMPDIVCFKDGEGRWLLANDFDLKLFQLEGVDYRGKKDSELAAYSDFYRDAFLACEGSDEAAWKKGTASRADEIIPRPDGTQMIFDIIKLPTFHADGRRKGLIVVGRDITERKRAEEQLQHLAHFDPLTQLPNRILLTDRLHIATAQARRSGKLLAVCYLDLDGFKPINDNHGHDVGDRLLIEVANRLLESLREGDSVGRLGGDEFVLLIGQLDDENECRHTLDRVLDVLARPYRVGSLNLTLSASIGVTLFPSDAMDSDTLLRHADQAMYDAKNAGRNRYQFFDPNRDRRMREFREVVSRIAQALDDGEFELYFQPKVNMRLGTVHGMEALIRWLHPERGLLLPNDFLPQVSDSDLAADIDYWVISQALRQAQSWAVAGMPMSVSVNVTAYTLGRSDFAERLEALLATSPELPANTLEIEILESVALDDINRVSVIIDRCRKLGVSFALDDFGTGYSSLLYLRHLPAEVLKIDQSFVRDMLEDPGDFAIVEGIIRLAETFQRAVIAEGVCSEEHGAMLMQLGCDLAQGFGVAVPMPAGDIEAWVRGYRQPPRWAAQDEAHGFHSDQPLLLMALEHRRWVTRLLEMMDTDDIQESVHLGLELNTRECRFGRWYYGAGQRRFGHLVAFHDLENVHGAIHRLASDLVTTCTAGQPDQARLRKQELLAMQDELLAQLDKLRQH